MYFPVWHLHRFLSADLGRGIYLKHLNGLIKVVGFRFKPKALKSQTLKP